jgi:ABC-type dipeptide/oligopeptide/nickel transport system permease subunit
MSAAVREGLFWQLADGFRASPFALGALVVTVLIVLAAVFAPWIAPHGPREQNLARDR